mgnify:CR=1 FL=1
MREVLRSIVYEVALAELDRRIWLLQDVHMEKELSGYWVVYRMD